MNEITDNKSITLRVLGPNGKPYIELDSQLKKEFEEQGFYFSVPMLFSSPVETTVAITIGIGVVTGVSTHLIASLIDKVLKIKKDKNQENTTISFNVQIGDKYINLPSNKDDLLREIEKIKDECK